MTPLGGFGSTYSSHTTKQADGSQLTTSSYSVGMAALGLQFNFDAKGKLSDIRYGLDSGVSLAALVGFDLNVQIGGIYKLH